MFYKKYYPDYKKLYPNEKLTPELIKAARQSDRKMKHCEYDLKHGKPIYRNADTGVITTRKDPNAVIAESEPSREISLEMLLESGEKAFVYLIDEYADPFDEIVKKERYTELYRCIALLSLSERRLIYALFWDKMSETNYAELIGRRQSSINEMKHRILEKLKKNLKKDKKFSK